MKARLRKMTNYEAIKNMSIDELSELINDFTRRCRYDECSDCPISKYVVNGYCGKSTVINFLTAECDTSTEV